MVHKFCYLNNKVTEFTKARLSPADLGVLRSYAVFDLMRTYNSVPFLFEKHFNRLKDSAELLRIPFERTEVEVREVVEDLLKKNRVTEANIRMVLTGGPMTDGFKPVNPTFYILIEELKTLPDSVYESGGKLLITEHRREFASAKTSNYLMAAWMRKETESNEAVELLYVSNGEVLEPSTSSIFIVNKEVLITPKENVLPGITKDFVMGLAQQQGYRVEERKVGLDELKTADEIFITATNKEIVPIVKIDDNIVRNGKIGKITQHLMGLFKESVKQYV